MAQTLKPSFEGTAPNLTTEDRIAPNTLFLFYFYAISFAIADNRDINSGA